MNATVPAVRMKGISKAFGGVRALDGVDFEVLPGEVHALLGGNGAGKSTILKVLNGVHQPDEGTIEVGGVPLTTHTPEASRAAGIAMNYQEMSLIPTLTVAQNVFLTRESRDRMGQIDDAQTERRAAEIFALLEVSVDPKAIVGDLGAGQKQLTEIAKAISPKAILPKIVGNIDDFGATDEAIFGGTIPIRGVAGDQQAAMIGQACFEPGMLKSTYGTGCFALLNTGADRVASNHRLLTTIAYRIDGQICYALEGSIFVAGAAVQWLRDGLGLIDKAKRSGTLAENADASQSVYLVPAFTGLGAPWWDSDVRGALYGLTRSTGPAELAKAALESVCFQTRDLLQVMRKDWPGAAETRLCVDGGMAASDWTMQRLADILDVPVDRPVVNETTALGAAWLAGCGAGVWPDMPGFARSWKKDRRFVPGMDDGQRQRLILGWRAAVKCTLGFSTKQR